MRWRAAGFENFEGSTDHTPVNLEEAAAEIAVESTWIRNRMGVGVHLGWKCGDCCKSALVVEDVLVEIVVYTC
jgi:hypothetical protein